MWSSLPSNLRAVLGAALLLGIGVAVAAFALSFFALREAAENPALKFGAGHAWLFPIGVDMALIFFEVLLIGASMVRVHERGRVVPYPRAIPFLLVLVAAASTLYFNATRVPTEVRPIALAVPVASILVTLGLAYLLKMLAAASGVEAIHLAPPSVDPKPIVRSTDVLHAEVERVPVGETPSLDRSRTGHTGQRGSGVGGGERGATTRAIEAILADLDPDRLTEIGDPGVVGLVEERYGLLTTPGYVNKVRRNGNGRP
jgi:uncharacterized protein DUF2637